MDLSGVSRKIVVPVRTDKLGVEGPTRSQARRKEWRRTSSGRYVPASVDGGLLDQRIAEAAAVLPTRYGAVTGWAALAWQRARWFDGTDGTRQLPVTLVTMRSMVRSQPGIHVTQERVTPEDIIVVDGLRITRAVTSVCFEVRHADSLRMAVRHLDMGCYDDLVSLQEVADYTCRYLSGWDGVPLLRAATALAHENSWSPRECDMRGAWQVPGRTTRPIPNLALFDLAGRHIGTPDLVDLTAGVAGDYDSDLHLVDGRRTGVDLDREARFRDHGLEYVTMMKTDHPDTARFRRRLAGAYDRALERPGRRAWTAEPPQWWRFTGTVEARRALDDFDRQHWLRHRSA